MSIRNKHILSMALMAVLFAMVGCESNKDFDFFISKYYVEPSITTVNIGGTYDSKATFDIKSDCEWRISCDQSWLEIEPVNGTGNATINLKVTNENSAAVGDEAKLTITADNGKICPVVTVKRGVGSSSISVSPSTLDFLSAEETLTFDVTCNSNWEMQPCTQAWIKDIVVKPIKEGTPVEGTFKQGIKSEGNASVEVTVNTNNREAPNTTELTFTNLTTSGTAKITLNQAKYSPEISTSLEDNTIHFGVGGGERSFQILCSDAWEIEAPYPTQDPWYTLSDTEGTTSKRIIITAQPNNGNARDWEFTVRNKKNSSYYIDIKVTQDGADEYLNVLEDMETIHLSAMGGHHPVMLSSSSEVTANTTAEWIRIESMGRIEDDRYEFMIFAETPNPSLNERSGRVTFTNGRASVEVRVIQEAGFFELVTDLSETNGIIRFGENHGTQELTFRASSEVAFTVPQNAQEWLIVEPREVYDEYAMFTVMAEPNSGEARSATLIFASSGRNINIEVQQAAHNVTLNIDPMHLEVDPQGGRYRIAVTSSDTWEAVSNQNWCQLVQASGTGAGNIEFSVMANPTTDGREARIAVMVKGSADEPVYCNVIQRPSSPVYFDNDSIGATISNVTKYGFRVSGSFYSDSDVTEVGLCVSDTNPNPTTAVQTLTQNIREDYEFEVLNLSSATKYYVRVYAVNITGKYYTKTVAVTTAGDVPNEDDNNPPHID